MVFLELNLNIKEDNANERTRLFTFIRFIKKNKVKRTSKIADEGKITTATEENKLTVMITRHLREFKWHWKFMCTNKGNDKNKTNLLPSPPPPLSPPTLVTIFLIAEKLLTL